MITSALLFFLACGEEEKEDTSVELSVDTAVEESEEVESTEESEETEATEESGEEESEETEESGE